MDPVAISGFITGGGGILVALVTGFWAKRGKDDEVGVSYVKLALETQNNQISKGELERAQQNLIIDELRQEVRECHRDKDRAKLDLAEERRERQRLASRVAALERERPAS